MGGALTGEAIRGLVLGPEQLIADYFDLDAQIQPNGIDLTLAELFTFDGPGIIAIDNVNRRLPEVTLIAPVSGFVELAPGPYHLTYRETVRIPKNLMALGRPRSSLARCGVMLHTAVWDAGYVGRSTSLLVVVNPAGARFEIGARIAQLVFFPLSAEVLTGYEGIYQDENLPG